MNNGNENSAETSATSSEGAVKAKTPKMSADTKFPKVTEGDKTLETHFYALLIGINCYLPNKLPDGGTYQSLKGCVRDINLIEGFLKGELHIPSTHILKLTSTVSQDDLSKPIESGDQLPTRQNIVNSFYKLGSMVPSGSLVYIHYSGHGGRAKTLFPDAKGEDGIDEGLVPTDIGTPDGQYIRDLELAKILQEFESKGLLVTLVLDCCHSGGATRGEEVGIRGIESIDDKPLLPDQELIAPLETLVSTWKSLSPEGTRSLKAGGVPAPQGCVVLAACRQHESAYEYAFNRETKERNGALTYWLVDTLRQQIPGQNYKDLYNRIHAKVHSQFRQQTPILIGAETRTVFGNELAEGLYAATVLQVKEDKSTGEPQVELSVGQAYGIGKGAEFAIYPGGTRNLTKANQIAIALLSERGATESWCKLTPIEGKELKVEPGDLAVLTSPQVDLVRQVALIQEWEIATGVLDRLKAAFSNNGWVELADESPDEEDADEIAYQVVVSGDGEYMICDRTGMPLKEIPYLSINAPDAAATLVKQLIHLAKFHATEELENTDKSSSLAGRLAVEWLGTSDTYTSGDKIPPKSRMNPFPDSTKPAVKRGEYIFLKIQNNSSHALNIVVLDLASDWSIEQIFPGKGENFYTLDEENNKVVIPIPAGETGEDIVKVLATLGPVDFRWLELPQMGEEIKGRSATRAVNPLEAMFAAIAAEQPPKRKLNQVSMLSSQWVTKQISLTVTE